jgi:predicted nucleic acid-binding protein
LVYVVDASVVLKWFLPEKDSGLADSLLEDFLNGDAELIAPDLILLEAANALWKRVELARNFRQRRLRSSTAICSRFLFL